MATAALAGCLSVVNDGRLTVASCNVYKSQQNTLQLAAVPHTPVVCPTILARPSEHSGHLSRRWPFYNAAVYTSRSDITTHAQR